MISNTSIIDKGIDTSDATAVASNIDNGKTAYVKGEKVTGTSTKVDTSDATATAAEISSGKTAYVNGNKVTGTSTAKEVKSITYSGSVYDGRSTKILFASATGGSAYDTLTLGVGAELWVMTYNQSRCRIVVKLNY